MDDLALTTLLKESNPARTRPDAPLTLRQRMMLERLMAEPAVGARKTWGKTALVVSLPLAAMVVVLMVVVAVVQPFGAAPASAYGPAPLEYRDTGQTLDQVVHAAEERLVASPGITESLREATTTAWSLHISEAGEPEETAVIAPTVTELEWKEDLSGRSIVSAGEPFAAVGSTPVPQDDELPVGSVIDERIFGPGEFPVISPDAATLGARAIADLIELYVPDPARAGDAFAAANDLQGEWTLTNAQHAAFLRALLAYDSLTVAGETTDRLGRDVIGLQGLTSVDGQQATLLLSADTGRIVGIETVVIADDGAVPVPVGTVFSYALWKDAP